MKGNFIYEVLAVTAAASAFLFIAHTEPSYNRKAVCVSSYQGEYTFEDRNGELWGYDTDAESFITGAEYVLKMNDNHTPMNIYDDIIITVKKG